MARLSPAPLSLHPRRTGAFRLGASAALLLALGGCISLGGKVPPYLLTLDAAAAPQVAAPRTASEANVLTILIPTAPQKLKTTRIPVQQADDTVAYVVEAQWVEAPTRLFQRLLSETVMARSNRVVLDEGQYLTAPGDQLAGQLLEFGVDARTNEVVAVYQAMLVTAGGKSVTQKRFEARERIAAVESKAVGAALGVAANRIAADVAAWLAQ